MSSNTRFVIIVKNVFLKFESLFCHYNRTVIIVIVNYSEWNTVYFQFLQLLLPPNLFFFVFVTYLFYSNLQTIQTSLFFLTVSIIYLNIFLATAIEFLDVFVGLLSDSRDWWTKGSPLIHTYCFSSATDRSQDVLERVSVVLGCDSKDLIDVRRVF